MVTAEKVAQLSGVSLSTVSQVLGDRAHLFRAETREKVVRAAQKLGYRPNSSARAMRSGRLGAIGLLLSTEEHRSSLFEKMLVGIYDELVRQNLRLNVARFPDKALTDEGFVPQILREWSCDGLLINYNALIPPRMVELIQNYKIPSVWINSQRDTDAIRPDDFGAGVIATEYLLKLGHRRIAYASYSGGGHYSTTDRRDGYAHAMKQAGLAPQIIGAQTGSSFERSQRIQASRQWLEQSDRPTAVITYAGSTALPIIMAAIGELGMRVPRDLSLVTFDDSLFDDCGLAVSTMVIPEYELGQTAARMLEQKIKTSGQSLPSQVLTMQLVQGNSCQSII
ncbi:MAG: LacI family DNA-binding transcriptional regulator [Phycisphaerales bacterium]|nr:LacI family DNA-binding transcriptional regulator [Phycisphaerales bacterium]